MTLVHPAAHARERASAPALIMASSGDVVSYGQLEERSNRMAHALRAHGLATGGHVALLLENNRAYLRRPGPPSAAASTTRPSTATCGRPRCSTSSTTAVPGRW